MPKASEVAAYLRNLADRLDENPDAKIMRPMVSFHHWEDRDKDKFLTVARLFPKPLNMEFRSLNCTLSHEDEAGYLYARIPERSVCKTVKEPVPAKYELDPDFLNKLNQ